MEVLNDFKMGRLDVGEHPYQLDQEYMRLRCQQC